MIRSKKYWDELLKNSKNEKLEPLEVVPLEEQNKQAKELEKKKNCCY